MGLAKRELERCEYLHSQAIEVAKQANAVEECHFGHTDVVLDTGDDEAKKRAYAIGTNLWKEGMVDCDRREEFMDAIKEAIESSPFECPECEYMMAKD